MSDHRREQALALLGLHACEPGRQPHGAAPDDEELALLIEGRLDAVRRGEVLSHVAADQHLYRQLLTLSELQAPAAETPAAAKRSAWFDAIAARMHDWRMAMATGALGGATAAAVIASVLVWQSVSGPEPAAVELVAQPAQRQQELATGTDLTALSLPWETTARCERLSYPDAERRGGNLCVLTLPTAGDDGVARPAAQHWLWIGEGSADAWLQRRSGERLLALRASGDAAWIALHGRVGDRASLQVHAVATLQQGRFEPVIDLELGSSGVSAMQWRGGQLEFVAWRDFAGDPDSPRDLDAPVRQRVSPDSGRIERVH